MTAAWSVWVSLNVAEEACQLPPKNSFAFTIPFLLLSLQIRPALQALVTWKHSLDTVASPAVLCKEKYTKRRQQDSI